MEAEEKLVNPQVEVKTNLERLVDYLSDDDDDNDDEDEATEAGGDDDDEFALTLAEENEKEEALGNDATDCKFKETKESQREKLPENVEIETESQEDEIGIETEKEVRDERVEELEETEKEDLKEVKLQVRKDDRAEELEMAKQATELEKVMPNEDLSKAEKNLLPEEKELLKEEKKRNEEPCASPFNGTAVQKDSPLEVSSSLCRCLFFPTCLTPLAFLQTPRRRPAAAASKARRATVPRNANLSGSKWVRTRLRLLARRTVTVGRAAAALKRFSKEVSLRDQFLLSNKDNNINADRQITHKALS